MWSFEAFDVFLRKNDKEKRICGPFEIISRVIGGLNLLRGLFLFVVFCCKAQVWDLVTCRRKKRPTLAGARVTKINVRDTGVSASSEAKECRNSKDSISIQLPEKEQPTTAESSRDQRDTESIGDQINCQQSPDLPENSIDQKVSSELGKEDLICSLEASREIPTTDSHKTEAESDDVSPIGDSKLTLETILEDEENSEQTVQRATNTTITQNRKDSDVGIRTQQGLAKRERKKRSKSARWTQRFSTSPSEWGPGWVQSLKVRMEVGQSSPTTSKTEKLEKGTRNNTV